MSLGELYGFVVYDCGITPGYFLDYMSAEEVGYLSTSYIKKHKERWEMLRMTVHATVAAQSPKPIKATDVMKFAWDNSDDSTEITVKDVDEARERIKNKFNLQNI